MDWKQHALEQEAHIKQLQARIAELEAEIAALHKNSSNSSRPPSSDIVNPPKEVQATKTRPKRKRGGQPGHKQNLRTPFEESQIDKIVNLTLNSCPTFGHNLVLTTEPPKTFQQVEIVDKPFIVTEYRRNLYWCEHCQCYHTADLPLGVEKAGLFGPQLISLTAYLKGRGHMSYKTLQDFFSDVLSLNVSTGFLANQVHKVSDAMAASYEELLKNLPNALHIHADETGLKENGEKRWVWCFRTGTFTLFHIDPSRGCIVLKTLLGLEYTGIISCDFWGAYRKFARLISADLQFCWAHLIREIKFLAESKNKSVARYGRRLLKQVQAMFSTIHCRDELSDQIWNQRMQAHREAILKTAWGTIPDDKDAINIAERLWNWQDAYFLFIEQNIPPTNNLGEQTIRKVVIDRKVTQGTRSDWGNRWQERFWSILTTCEQQGKNVMAFLNACVKSLLHGLAPPSLING